MKRFTIFAVIMLFLSVNVFATKRALVIGLGKQQDSIHWNKINGDNDVKKYVIPMLNNCGYRGHIKSLVNSQATKKNIVDAFKTLTGQCKSGDIVYIHFSGHGQRVVDKNDTKRESWVPYDAYYKYCNKDKGDKHLMEYEINGLLHKIVNKIGSRGKLLVVVDACCSGGSTRGDDDVDEDEDDAVARWAKDEFKLPSALLPKEDLKSKWIALYACKPYEKAWEISDFKVGKLSYAIYNVADKGRVEFPKIEKFMLNYRNRLTQTPYVKSDCSYNIWDVLK